MPLWFDASFIRLKTWHELYTPSKNMGANFIYRGKTCTFTSYRGLDPENYSDVHVFLLYVLFHWELN
jgi:hypothetical protein